MKMNKVALDYNPEDIKQLVKPYWDYMSFGRDFKDYTPEPQFLWYRMEVDENLAGYFCCYEDVPQTASVHVCIKEEYRPHKQELIEEWKKVLKETLPKHIDYLVAFVPKKLSATIAFALENGFDLLTIQEGQDVGKVFVMGTPLDEFINEVEIK